MDKVASDRRRTLRHYVRTRVRMFNDKTQSFENAHLENISPRGVYIMTRNRMAIGQEAVIAVPSETEKDCLRIRVKVVRKGNHRAWGLFSYAMQILGSE